MTLSPDRIRALIEQARFHDPGAGGLIVRSTAFGPRYATMDDLTRFANLACAECAREAAVMGKLRLERKELVGLPQELLSELSSEAFLSDRDVLYVNLIRCRGGSANLDQLIIDVYRTTGEVTKRVTLNSRLWRLKKAGLLVMDADRRGYYRPAATP